MNMITNFSKGITALTVSITTKTIGGMDTLLYALLSFIIIDYITGVILAIKNKKLSSEIGYKGISKKVALLMIVCMGNIMDKYVLYTGSTLRTMIVMFYLANEAISILENVGNIGLSIPKKLKDAIEKLNSEK